MLSFKNRFFQWISRVVTVILTVVFCVPSLIGGIRKEPDRTPDDFQPILRFVVCSDIHLDANDPEKNAIRTAQMFQDAYAYADASEAYRRLDAVLVAGDFATKGDEEEYRLFNKIVKENKRDETRMLTVMGNHEFIKYRDVDASVGYDVYRACMGDNIDTHTVINGYHFIGVSYDPDGKSFTHKLPWLNRELEKAAKEDPTRPIFVFQHPHPFLTVYGSVDWSNLGVRMVLDRYPQVVDFSGHSHYTAADPRSIWQGAFTAVGTGALCAYMGNLNYIDGAEDAPGESGGFWIVEADADGRVRLQHYDIASHRLFAEADYFLTDLHCVTKRPYSWGNQLLRDTPPRFPQEAELSVKAGEDGDVLLCFPDAAGYFEAESYQLIVRNARHKTVFEDTVLSDSVRAGRTGVTVSLGALEAGSYTVCVTACSPYGKTGDTLRGTVNVPA